MNKQLLLVTIFLLTLTQLFADNNTFVAHKASTYNIDGIADEAFWQNCEWYDIKYVWIPYGASMEDGDFSGKVKFAWTEDVLLVYAEIEDDVLNDAHSNPTSNYWDDDCFEVFLDEDKSGGDHERGDVAYNAFAYHCAINEKDVIDIGSDGFVQLNDHIEFDIDTIGENLYTWELAIKIYDDSYTEGSANTPVSLIHGKQMGLSLAYCDNDGGSSRENFIGLVNVSEADYNSAWQNASVFGTLTLTDGSSPIKENIAPLYFSCYPTHATSNITLCGTDLNLRNAHISIVAIDGRLVNHEINSNYRENTLSVNVQNLSPGQYFVKLIADEKVYTATFVKK